MILQHTKEHAWIIATALLVGVISVAPHIFFIFNPANNYRGIPVFQSPNEEAYLAIMQEIADGHFLAASVPFFEYKDTYPLLPPTIPFFYAAFSKLFGISLASTLIVSKFFLPMVLFLLVYILAYLMNRDGEIWQRKLNGIAASSMVVFGFELQDYRMLWKFLTGDFPVGSFIIWTRPVSPVAGGILLFVLLISIWLFLTKKNNLIFPAGVSLAIMMASYVFSWSLALAIMGVLGMYALIKQEWRLLKFLAGIFLLAAFLSAPYWIMAWRASQMPWYSEAASRIGFWHYSAPHFNKFLIFVSVIFIVVSYFKLYRQKQKFPLWWGFSLSWILAGFFAYNQQVITGKEIWYYHYVFYTIPLGYLILISVWWHFLRSRYSRIWLAGISLAIVASFSLVIYGQASVYYKNYEFYKDLQKYADVFDFLNNQTPKDSVVFARQDKPVDISRDFQLSTYITALTHSNTYFSGERLMAAPPERFYNNYLSLLRLRGVSAEEIDDYLEKHRVEAAAYLFYDIHYTLGYPDPKLDEELKRLPGDYKKFLQKDFYKELKKYRLDYILSIGSLDQKVVKSLPPMNKVFDKDDIMLYALP